MKTGTPTGWLLEGDLAIRWQASNDLAWERAGVAQEVWGAGFLALQDPGTSYSDPTAPAPWSIRRPDLRSRRAGTTTSSAPSTTSGMPTPSATRPWKK
jgi:hypothetical protein